MNEKEKKTLIQRMFQPIQKYLLSKKLHLLIKKSFPIVGIGASAGGLAAFEAFFSGMPADIDPGMSFVLVQHLAPDHKSILTELVRRLYAHAGF